MTGPVADLHDALHRALSGALDDAAAQQITAWAAAWEDLAQAWAEALAQIEQMMADGDVSRSAVLRASKVRQALDHTARRLDLLTNGTVNIAGGILPQVVTAAAAAEVAMLVAQLPPAFAVSDRLAAGALDAIVQRTTQNITSLTAPLSRQAVVEVETILVQTVAGGDNPRAAARRLLRQVEDRVNLTRDRADTIMRTEVVDAHRTAALKARQENTSLLAGWRWVTARDERTCRACLSRHGHVYPVDEPGPLGHQRCRCTGAPVTKSWRELGIPLDEPPREVETGEEWLRKQSRAVQDETLTPAGAAAWRRGDWPASQWAVKRSTDGWRDAYYQARPPKR